MNQHTHSRAGLFLLELMLNILLFSVLVALCLQFLFKAHSISSSTRDFYRAADTCTSIAEIYQSGTDGKESLLHIYPDAILLNENLLIFFDENFNGCPEEKSCYRAFISFSDNVYQTAIITFSANDSSDELYQLTVCGYHPHSLSELTGGVYQ